jgi:hypothetical protein
MTASSSPPQSFLVLTGVSTSNYAANATSEFGQVRLPLKSTAGGPIANGEAVIELRLIEKDRLDESTTMQLREREKWHGLRFRNKIVRDAVAFTISVDGSARSIEKEAQTIWRLLECSLSLACVHPSYSGYTTLLETQVRGDHIRLSNSFDVGMLAIGHPIYSPLYQNSAAYNELSASALSYRSNESVICTGPRKGEIAVADAWWNRARIIFEKLAQFQRNSDVPRFVGLALESFLRARTTAKLHLGFPDYIRAIEAVVALPKRHGATTFAERTGKLLIDAYLPYLSRAYYDQAKWEERRNNQTWDDDPLIFILKKAYEARNECVHGKEPFDGAKGSTPADTAANEKVAGDATPERLRIMQLEYLAEQAARIAVLFGLFCPEEARKKLRDRPQLESAWDSDEWKAQFLTAADVVHRDLKPQRMWGDPSPNPPAP